MRPLTRAELKAALTPRTPDSHKGSFGHLLLVAGSRGMAGASILSTRAALRSGVGVVTLAVPASLQPVVAGQVPEALTIGLSENSAGSVRLEGVSRLKQAHKERGYEALALGPGLSQQSDAAKFVIGLLSSLSIPAVIDADGLNNLAAQPPAGVRKLLNGRGAPNIFTPHPGEMARCLGVRASEVQRGREAAAKRLAREWSGVALLKGRQTVISDDERAVENPTGGPGLAKGGTGDVLTGLIGGLWAQAIASGRDPRRSAFGAAALGAYLHGAAGDAAERARTAWAMTAQDVVDHLPDALKRL